MLMSSAETAHRSYLFAPGSDPRVMRKALVAGADAVVLDLEDAVAAAAKASAREEVARLLDEVDQEEGPPPERPAVHIRINRTISGYEQLDLDVAVHPAVEAVRLPKVEGADDVRIVSSSIAELERLRGIPIGSITLYPTIESAQGVLRSEAISSSDPRVARLVIGHEDLVADLAGRGDDSLTLLIPAAMVALSSRSAGIGAPVDGATTDITDAEALAEAIHRARALGFFGKSAIHPRQLPAIHAGFSPSDEEIAAASRIVHEASAAPDGALSLDGRLIDAAIVRRARGVLELRRDL